MFSKSLFWSICVLLLAHALQAQPSRIEYHKNFHSAFVEQRNVEVYIPPNYNPGKKYPVVYMHDGQNVFNAATAFSGNEWGVDEAATELIQKGDLQSVIIVASWNSNKRFEEYMPAKPAEKVAELFRKDTVKRRIQADNYLKFLVYELKPFIDKNYSTLPAREHTFIMGSSMGGLISAYAVCEYPEVFGGAACLSTHWPALNGIFLSYLKEHLPKAGKHRFYFDFGTITLDSLYQPYQTVADSLLKKAGYSFGKDWLTTKFVGEPHNEVAWRRRIHIPLTFLLSTSLSK